MDIETVRTIIENSSTSGFLDLSFMYYDLGKDENYLDEQKKRLVNSPTPQDTLDREVLNIWKDTSTEHPFGQERISTLNSLSKRPTDHIIINNMYSMRIYVDINTFDWGKPLIGGLDLGGNLKNDFSVLVIIDPSDFSVIGVMRTNSQSTTLFAFAIISIMSDLCKGLILFPERNYNGAIIDQVVSYLPNSRARVYHEDEDRAGLFNSKKVRPVLFNVILRLAIDDYGSKIYDKTIISEIEGLIRTRSGRIDHKPGKHDDTLVAYLLALYFLLYVDDIHKYMDKSIILSKYDKNNMIGVKTQINKGSDKLKKLTSNSYLQLIDKKKQINSLDDVADIIYNASQNTSIDTSIQRYSGDNDLEKIEESDDLSEVRTSIEKMKDEESDSMKGLYIDTSKESNTDEFKQVFGTQFHKDDKSSFQKTFGW